MTNLQFVEWSFSSLERTYDTPPPERYAEFAISESLVEGLNIVHVWPQLGHHHEI